MSPLRSLLSRCPATPLRPLLSRCPATPPSHKLYRGRAMSSNREPGQPWLLNAQMLNAQIVVIQGIVFGFITGNVASNLYGKYLRRQELEEEKKKKREEEKEKKRENH